MDRKGKEPQSTPIKAKRSQLKGEPITRRHLGEAEMKLGLFRN